MCGLFDVGLKHLEKYHLFFFFFFFPCFQGPEHPNPGKSFSARGFPRHCYLPDSEKGRKVRSVGLGMCFSVRAPSLLPVMRKGTGSLFTLDVTKSYSSVLEVRVGVIRILFLQGDGGWAFDFLLS